MNVNIDSKSFEPKKNQKNIALESVTFGNIFIFMNIYILHRICGYQPLLHMLYKTFQTLLRVSILSFVITYYARNRTDISLKTKR